MPRYKMTVEYDGGPYVGWQRQTNGPSVQGAIEGAILSLTRRRFPPVARGAPILVSMPWVRSCMWTLSGNGNPIPYAKH